MARETKLKQYEDILEYKVQFPLLDEDVKDNKKFHEVTAKTLRQNQEVVRLLKEFYDRIKTQS